jgi:phage baseplate assembly protein V
MSINAMKNLVSAAVKPIRNRVYTMITRAVLESTKDSEGMQLVKLNLLAGETREDVEHFQNFGFSSHAPKKSEAVALAMGGNRDHLIVIVADDRNTRVKDLAEGESVFYNINGDKLILKANGDLEKTLSNNYKATIAENMEVTLKKLKFENETSELIEELRRMAEALSVEPFIVNKGTFADIQTKILSFKVT